MTTGEKIARKCGIISQIEIRGFVMSELTHAKLKELLDYNAETGVFRWRAGRSRNAWVGKVAGTAEHGYIRITIGLGEGNRARHLAHRLAWFYVNGKWPALFLDHINGRTDDNRISNLREATAAQNCQNAKVHRSQRIGLKGVNRSKRGYMARIMMSGQSHYLGYFKTPEAAHAAYCAAAARLFGPFARRE